MNYERMFQGLAILLAAAAGFFLSQEKLDTAFVSGVLAAVAFFLSVRVPIKSRLAQRSADEAEDDALPQFR